VCAHSPGGHPYPGLHQRKHGQHVKGGDSAPLLCSAEAPTEVLCPALKPSAQDRPGPGGVGLEECHNNDPRAGTPLLGGKAGRAGAVQPGEEKAAERSSDSLSVLEVGL